MVHGLDVFKNYFKGFEENYVLIGGSACDLIFSSLQASFRKTSDLDIVIIIESYEEAFLNLMLQFIKSGWYKPYYSEKDGVHFYRFLDPEYKNYPSKIELFSRAPISTPILEDMKFIKISSDIGDTFSYLSGILLNRDYYNFLYNGRTLINDLPVLKPYYLIPFKIKAWLNLTELKNSGVFVNSDEIDKHRKDVYRLMGILLGNESFIDGRADLTYQIRLDILNYIDIMLEIDNKSDMRNFGIIGYSSYEVLCKLKEFYS